MTGLKLRRLLLVAGAISMLAVPATASANGGSDGSGYSKKLDYVFGSTTRALLGDAVGQTAKISVAAASGASGQYPIGLINVINSTRKTNVWETVKCLRVEGNLATAGATVISSNDPSFPKGTSLHWWFADNGPAALRKDGAFSTPIGSVVDPTVCPVPVAFTRDDLKGGYIIHDAQPGT